MKTLTTEDKLAEALIQKGKLTAKDRDRLLRLGKDRSRPFVELLCEEKILSEKELLHSLSETFELPILRLKSYQLDPSLLKRLPHPLAERYGVIPVAHVGSFLTLATSRPLDLVALDDLERVTQSRIRLVLSPSSEIQNALASYETGAAALEAFVDEKAENGEIELLTEGGEAEVLELEQVSQAPVVRMVQQIIFEAIQARASDIHFEPYHDHFRIRYRIDGVLGETLRHSLEIYAAVIARIKILSFLDITERRVPQDGRFKLRTGGKEIDFRVSILPTFFGEKGVLRLLDKANVRSGLDELGFSEQPIQHFKEAIGRPYGMILVTGPTGSGKSTTLYSVLNLLNTPGRNLMTVEDPIEYQIEGITQTQVNPDINLTFASGLRSLLRQSPDVILVGEIRDPETADIAVKSALTGHLVLSTLHTNSAAGAVTRLIDMGVEPFLIASSVILVAGQRLLRRICPYCKVSAPIPEEALKRLSTTRLQVKEKMAFQGKGCEQCHGTGYQGRLGAIEVLPVDTRVREAILRRASSDEIERIGRDAGQETLFENALGLFKSGKTTLQEVLRVTQIEEA